MTGSRFADQWRRERSRGQPVICAGVGSGVTVRGAVEGRADLLAVYNTAVYRIDADQAASTAEASPVRASVADTIRRFKAAAARGQAPS